MRRKSEPSCDSRRESAEIGELRNRSRSIGDSESSRCSEADKTYFSYFPFWDSSLGLGVTSKKTGRVIRTIFMDAYRAIMVLRGAGIDSDSRRKNGNCGIEMSRSGMASDESGTC